MNIRKKMTEAKPSLKRSRRMQVERMEERLLFSRDEGAFVAAGSLTFSYPADGTPVGAQENVIGAKLASIGTQQQIREAIAEAMQTWLKHANVNFGMVEDNNAAIGVYGPSRGDSRFGDLRITGFDFSTDTFAEAVTQDTSTVGTWAGDIFFNTAASWPDLEAFQSAALHELGHVLGLEHSTDTTSPMHTHGGNGLLEPTSDDIGILQGLHGARAPDSNEGNHGNDTIDRASPLRGSEDDVSSDDGFNGTQVWIQFGDLLSEQDRDIYEIKTAATYQGPLSVEVRTAGLSLARLRVEVTDRSGTVLKSGGFSDAMGGKIQLDLPTVKGDEKYYVHVFSGQDAFWSQGDYSVTVASPTRFTNSGQDIATWSRDAHRWYFDSDGAKRGFSWQLLPNSDDHPDLDDDNGFDDSSQEARQLEPIINTPTRVIYRTVGTLSNLTDLDHFRVQAPSGATGEIDLQLTIESLEESGLVPEAVVQDTNGNPVASEVRVRGYGQMELVVANAVPDKEYVIQLKSTATLDAFKLGNFSLTVQFAAPKTPPLELIQGKLTNAVPTIEREWYVARPQLFSLALSNSGSSSQLNGQVWVTVFDEERKVVTAMVAPFGALRSSPGLLLESGKYYLQISAAIETGPLPDLDVRLVGEIVSDPIGPVIGATGVQPKYLCPGQTDKYCYPNSNTPTSVPTSVGSVAAGVTLPAAATTPAPRAGDLWFWKNDFRPTNPTRALDASGDNLVSPLDALLVINRLNLAGATPFPSPPVFVGYLDTSGDGNISPLDALLIINDLNLHGST